MLHPMVLRQIHSSIAMLSNPMESMESKRPTMSMFMNESRVDDRRSGLFVLVMLLLTVVLLRLSWRKGWERELLLKIP